VANAAVAEDPVSDHQWKHIVDAIVGGYCVPFLGAGASVAAGVPSARKLAGEIARLCDFPGKPDDLLRVCQYFAMVRDRAAPCRAVADRIRPHTTPGVVHEIIASMPFNLVLTTNFDTLMEQAFTDAGKPPKMMVYRRGGNLEDVTTVSTDRPLVYKLHGTIGDLDNELRLIVTEDAIVDFLACVLMRQPPLPELIKNVFTHHSVLFIGYGLKDWNVRVLLRALRGTSPTSRCFAVQKRPTKERAAKEWETTVIHLRRGEIETYDIDAVKFVKTMRQKYLERIGGVELTGVAV
jgi:hypothetical protein